uniref:Uncharacterized protein n=1 Tax=Opuntia streptacantha TaxID=393608 RepID=A0A7C8YFF2_OPUST
MRSHNIAEHNPENRRTRIFTLFLHPTANPAAVLSKPSIPLAPRLPATFIPQSGNSNQGALPVQFTIPLAYMSASRIGILFPMNKAVSETSMSERACETCGSVSEYSEKMWKDNSHATTELTACRKIVHLVLICGKGRFSRHPAN